jgi:hypothetical protein
MQSHNPDHEIANGVEPMDQKMEALNGCKSLESLDDVFVATIPRS